MNSYIEEINLIIDYDDFISIDVRPLIILIITYKQSDNTLTYLLNIKNEVLKSISNHDLVIC